MKIFIYVIILLSSLLATIQAFGSSGEMNPAENRHLKINKKDALSAQQLIQHKTLFNLKAEDALQFQQKLTDDLGYAHYRYQQTYKNLRVEGAQYILHEKNGLVESANGHLIANLAVAIEPAIQKTSALQIALSHQAAKKYAWQDEQHEQTLQQIKGDDEATFYPEGELVLFNPEFSDKAEDYRLSYKFDVYAIEPLSRQWVYVDAQNGNVLSSLNKMHTCSHSSASGNTNYSGQVNFLSCFDGGDYHLKNTLNCDIQVFNANATKSYTPLEVKQSGNTFNDDPSAVEVFWASKITYDYFLTEFQREDEGLDNSDLPIHSWVNYGENLNNAYWNGTWLTFGNGDGQNYGPFTSPDIVAHEITHSITDNSSKLSYYGESGALNESFSDIFGEVIEHEIHGTNDWIIGADIVKQPGKAGLRSMSNPTDVTMMTQQPDAYEGHYWYEGLGDNQGVHINSGVQNYWFYLLSEGGNVTNYFGDYFEIQGIEIENAAAIAYRTLTHYLTENSKYDDARYWSIQAAKDLFGYPSNEVIQTTAAWCAVNVGFNCVPLISNASCNRNTDSLALVELYNSTNGSNWNNSWNLNQPMNTWHGVHQNSKGCIIWLWLQNNNLTGNIPSAIGNLSNLTDINFSNNNLSGNIPAGLGNLKELIKLNLTSNQLEGSLPAQLSQLDKLRFLILTNNNFSGAIPNHLNQLGDLEKLTLSINDFSGNLPDLSYLQNLKEFSVSYNNLRGSIPAGFSNLISLERLSVNDNNLSGCFQGNLVSVCSHLNPQYNTSNHINKGNNFNESWENFCLNGAGSCSPDVPIGPVYPGDFNQNGVVEVSDLLHWGLAVGESGAERPGANTSWTAQDCPEWQNFVNGVNSKHQDGNGDGVVNNLDIAVLTQNYGLGTLNVQSNSSGSPVKYILDPVSASKNNGLIILTYDLKVRSIIGQPISAHGLSCNIKFSGLPIEDVSVNFDNTCLENPEYISIYDTNKKEINIAVTQSNKKITNCSTSIARVGIAVLEEIQGGDVYVISISNGSTISNNGTLSPAIGNSMYGVLSFANANNTFATQIQTTDEQCNALGKAVADVTGGTAPYTYSWSNGANTAVVDNLAAGAYSVIISDAMGESNTINIVINEPASVFDTQSGELLCGQACEDFLQPNGNVESGFYPAQNTLQSNASLTPNSQVTFQAGDRIRLNTGFTTRQSDKFSAKIGGCN